MITIILPDENQELKQDLSNEVLRDVCLRLYGSDQFSVQQEQRRNGRYIKVINDDHITYVCFSNPHNDSRNARLMQFISPAYNAFYDEEISQKRLAIYLIDPNHNDKTNYIRMFYRCFMTLGIDVINVEKLQLEDISPFTSYEDLRQYRLKTSGRNTHNNSSYFSDDDDQLSFYGKTFGANGMESFVLCLTLSRLTDRPIEFYPVLDSGSTSLSEKQREILAAANVNFGELIDEQSNQDVDLDQPEVALRDTPKFHFNLLKKFGSKYCYLCGCDMEHLIIGSHIERVTDIKNNPDYSVDDKKARIVAGDNGLWLCANHDKMFEFGIVYFDEAKLEYATNENQKAGEYFLKSLFDLRKIYISEGDVNVTYIGDEPSFSMAGEHFTESTAEYLKLHKARVRAV